MADVIAVVMAIFMFGFLIWAWGFCASGAWHDNAYREKGHCPEDNRLHKEAAKKKAEAERILGEG